MIARRLLTATRRYSTAPEKATALKILDSLPGNSLLSKTGYLTLGAGAATFIISKEIYVFNEETLILVSFSGILYSLIKALRGPYNAWAEEQINKMKGILETARDGHKEQVTQRIDQVGQLKDVVSVTENLFEMSKEMARMEAQIFELKQQQQLNTDVKAVLDSWVRHEASIREREQKQVAQRVLDQVMGSLGDAQVQQRILQQSLGDLDRALR